MGGGVNSAVETVPEPSAPKDVAHGTLHVAEVQHDRGLIEIGEDLREGLGAGRVDVVDSRAVEDERSRLVDEAGCPISEKALHVLSVDEGQRGVDPNDVDTGNRLGIGEPFEVS